MRTFDDAAKGLAYLEEDPERVRLARLRPRDAGHGRPRLPQRGARGRLPDSAVVLVTAFGSIDSAVEAMRVGADDYLTKPVDLYELRTRVANLLEKQQLREEVTTLRAQLDKRYGFESIIGHSPADRAAVREDEDGGADPLDGAHHRRERHRQGAGGQRPAPRQPAPRRALPRHQLRRHPQRHPGERAVRPRARRLHRRGGAQDRQVRAGPPGHPLPRRDQRAVPRAAGQAAARARGAADHAGGRRRADRRRLPADRRHQQGPREGGRARGASARTSTTGSRW